MYWFVSPRFKRGNDLFLHAPRRYTSCRFFFLRLTKRSDIFRASNFGVSLEYFGISLQTGGPTKRSTNLEKQIYVRKTKSIKLKCAEINPDTVQQYRTVQSYLVADYNRICIFFIVILKTRNFPDQTFFVHYSNKQDNISKI